MSVFKRIANLKPATLPALPPDAAALVQRQLNSTPLWHQVRRFWHELDAMQGGWLLVLPLLLWVGWRTYRKERKKVLKQRMTRQKNS